MSSKKGKKKTYLGNKKKQEKLLDEILKEDSSKTGINPIEKQFEKNKIKENKDKKDEKYEKSSNRRLSKNKKLIEVTPISEFFNKKIEYWKNEKINDLKDLENFCESIKIFDESNYKLLDELVNKNDQLFSKYYTTYQFTLNLKQRLLIQNKMKDLSIYPQMIRNNIINKSLTSIRQLYLDLCDKIININIKDKAFIETLLNDIMKLGIFIENKIEFKFPVRFGNIEIKFNKLIIETLYFIFQTKMDDIKTLDNDEITKIGCKVFQFRHLKTFFEKSSKYDDKELIDVCDYIINCYYILFEVDEEQRDYEKLKKIINCCLPFELEVAKEKIKEFEELGTCGFGISINGQQSSEFNVLNLSSELDIKFTSKKKK